MLNTTTIPARNLQKSYRSIIQSVKAKKGPVILTTQNKPQAALVSLEDLKKLQELKSKNSARALMEVVEKAHELLKDEKLPKDLSINHDYYAWGADKKSL